MKNNKRQGQGTYTFVEGTILKGTFKDGKFLGK